VGFRGSAEEWLKINENQRKSMDPGFASQQLARATFKKIIKAPSKLEEILFLKSWFTPGLKY
jgi:hypothetical protein